MANVKYARFVALAVVIAGSTGMAVAQGTASKPKPLATPPVLNGAEVVSRASDYVEPARTVITPGEKEAEKPVVEQLDQVKELTERIKKLEGQKDTYDERQKRMLLNLDILTRAEQRSESLRKQLFDMIEKENTVKARLDQLEIDIRPEAIERSLQMTGSMRPEEVRENRRKSLEAERRNLQALLSEIQSTRSKVANSLQSSDQIVDKLRIKLEKDIEDSFLKVDDPKDPA